MPPPLPSPAARGEGASHPAWSRRFFVLAVLVVLAVLSPGRAATALTLPEAVERALARFPAVEAARARQAEAEEALGEARASRKPKGRLTGSATQYQEPMVVTPIHGFSPGLFPEFDETLGQATLSVSYTLLDNGGIDAQVRSAGSQVEGAGAAVSSVEQLLARRVAAAYLTVLGQSQVLAAHDHRLDALRAELSRVRQRFDVGRAAKVEILRAEAALANAEADRVRLTAAIDNSERELARLLDIPVDETRVSRLAPAEVGDRSLSREELAAAGIEASPAVAQARSQVATAEAGVALARSILRPDLRAVGNYNEWTSSQGDFTGEWNVALQLTVPLFDGGVTRRRIARAEAGVRAAQEQVRAAEVQVREDVDRAAAAEEEAEARIASLTMAVERLAEVARMQKLLLEVGSGTQIDYLAAEAELARDPRQPRRGARTPPLLARVELARAAGELTPDWLRRTLETAP